VTAFRVAGVGAHQRISAPVTATKTPIAAAGSRRYWASRRRSATAQRERAGADEGDGGAAAGVEVWARVMLKTTQRRADAARTHAGGTECRCASLRHRGTGSAGGIASGAGPLSGASADRA